MSMGSEIMEEAYDKKVWEFLKILETMNKDLDRDKIIIEYQKHFKGYGFYGQE
jgi:hypothetical protein